MYVLRADLARRTPEATIDRIVELARIYRYREFVVETNQFQLMMLEVLRQKALLGQVTIPTRGVTNTANKQARIEGLEAYVSSGRLKFARSQTMLLEQLRHFPLGAHDDGPDALQLCVSWCAERRASGSGRTRGWY